MCAPKRYNGRGRWRWQLGVAFSLLLSLPMCSDSSPDDPGCRPPCTDADCGVVNEECLRGSFMRCGGCCTACLNGPGDPCDDNDEVVGPCGEGMECVQRTPYQPSTCVVLVTPSSSDPSPRPVPRTTSEPVPNPTPEPLPEPVPEPSPEPLPEPVPEPSPEPLPEPDPEPQPTPSPTSSSSGDEDMSVMCRSACSIEFCSETETKKKRICSAMGLSPVVPERNKCQHTTCRACFLLREPNCTAVPCKEPPTKDCLKRFYTCVRDHYFGPVATSNLLRLEDPEARATPGRVVCYVPQVEHVQGSSDEHDSSSSTNWP